MRTVIFALIAAFVISCGGGGGGNGSNQENTENSNSPPTISNLRYSTWGSRNAGSGDIHIWGTLEYSDVNGDISTLRTEDVLGNTNAVNLTDLGESGTVEVSAYIPTDDVGRYSFTVWLTDQAGNESNRLESSVQILPVAIPGDDDVVYPGAVVQLDGSESPQSTFEELAYHWEILGKPSNSNSVLTDDASLITSITADVQGVYELELTIADSSGNSDSKVITVTCIPEGYVTIGSHVDEVAALHGTPTSIYGTDNRLDDYDWEYGFLNKFKFSKENDRVIGWNDYDGIFHVIVVPGNNTTASDVITLGSHRDDVARIQGTPSAITKTELSLDYYDWEYGLLTYIRFSKEDDTVISWNNHDGTLIVGI